MNKCIHHENGSRLARVTLNEIVAETNNLSKLQLEKKIMESNYKQLVDVSLIMSLLL